MDTYFSEKPSHARFESRPVAFPRPGNYHVTTANRTIRYFRSIPRRGLAHATNIRLPERMRFSGEGKRNSIPDRPLLFGTVLLLQAARTESVRVKRSRTRRAIPLIAIEVCAVNYSVG